VAVGGGLSYGALGISHHATEDLAIMRALPNMMIASPGDPQEARLITNALVDYHGPAYLRLGRAGDTSVHQNLASIDLKNPLVLESGQDLAIVVTGGVLPQAMEATNILKSKGLGVKLISMPILKPLDQSRLLAYLEGIPAVFTVEEHSIVGGLGSLLAETLLESGYAPRIFHRIGLPNHQFHEAIGSRDFMLHHYGLDAAGIVYTVESILQARHAYGIS
ncbi:MAG: transketolase, partial [Cytophagales bacterium]|nr:transketolase [Cytophagales bacterium]